MKINIEYIVNIYFNNSFTKGSVVMVVYGAAGEFLAAIMGVATGQNWKQGSFYVIYPSVNMEIILRSFILSFS